MVVVSCQYKRCSRCSIFRRASTDTQQSEFYRRNKHSASLRAVCKPCDLERRRQFDTQNPELKRARQRDWLNRKRSDPEARAILKDQSREYWRRTRGVTPDRYRNRSGGHAKGKSYDPAPFAAWLETLGSDIPAIARVAELDPGQVRKILAGRPVRIDVVDRTLIAAGTATTIDDLYPIEGEQ